MFQDEKVAVQTLTLVRSMQKLSLVQALRYAGSQKAFVRRERYGKGNEVLARRVKKK